MKSLGIMKKRLVVAGVMASAVALVGVKVYADDASDIESFFSVGANVNYDNTADEDSEANGYPIITDIASMPGVFGGHTFTGWSLFADDGSGSLDLFTSVATVTNLTGTPGNDASTPPYGTP